MRTPLPNRLTEGGLVAVLRATAAEHYLPVAQALVAEGIDCIELTLTTPGTLDACASIVDALPEACVGVGTVVTAEQAQGVIDAGAAFIVTPVVHPEVTQKAVDHGIPLVCGALSPTEALAAWRGGASCVKLFPAATVGPGYVSQLHGPFPDMMVMPSGGIDIVDIPSWLQAGAVAVSLGGTLAGDALHGGSIRALRVRARQARAFADRHLQKA